MTQYPEAYLARELEMCVVNVALITDYDSGLHGNVDPVSHSEVVKVFSQNLLILQKMLRTSSNTCQWKEVIANADRRSNTLGFCSQNKRHMVQTANETTDKMDSQITNQLTNQDHNPKITN